LSKILSGLLTLLRFTKILKENRLDSILDEPMSKTVQTIILDQSKINNPKLMNVPQFWFSYLIFNFKL